MSEPITHCPLCHESVPPESLQQHIQSEAQAIREYTIKMIKAQHPEWVEANGACPECWKHYRQL